jgi:cytochrome c oxidase subunit 2
MVGPTLKGLFGLQQTVIVDGVEHTAAVDEAYLRNSIQKPMTERAKGYPPTMPPSNLTEKELADVVDYIKALK